MSIEIRDVRDFPFRADCLAAQYPAKAPGAHGGAQHPTARHAEPE